MRLADAGCGRCHTEKRPWQRLPVLAGGGAVLPIVLLIATVSAFAGASTAGPGQTRHAEAIAAHVDLPDRAVWR
ncbi:MAG: hypothetical protein D6801_06395 [Alphaproteobacteria bacterium]|nr:MAG: hypothetical protein D6801_06395 [Alphaproteobacteria bacterium]